MSAKTMWRLSMIGLFCLGLALGTTFDTVYHDHQTLKELVVRYDRLNASIVKLNEYLAIEPMIKRSEEKKI